MIVDQFEEVLAQDCDLLLQQIADLPDDGLLTVVLTLREDSFGSIFRASHELRGTAATECGCLARHGRCRAGEVIRGQLRYAVCGSQIALLVSS